MTSRSADDWNARYRGSDLVWGAAPNLDAGYTAGRDGVAIAVVARVLPETRTQIR